MLQVSRSMSTNTGVAPSEHDHLAGGDERERRGDHLVAAADAERHQRDQQRLGAARARDAVLGADVRGEALLELADLRAHDVLAVVEHGLDARASVGRGLLAPAGGCYLIVIGTVSRMSSVVPACAFTAIFNSRGPRIETRCRAHWCSRPGLRS